jgi:16S rRNA (uracil1498-N3)-methyltransferase
MVAHRARLDYLDPGTCGANVTSPPPRFRISSSAIQADRARLEGPELHHLRDVLRMRPGDAAALIDDHGRILDARIASIDATHAVLTLRQINEPSSAPLIPLILALAIIKGPRMDLAIEKAVELGATEVWPLVSARCVARDPGRERLVRWRRLAAAASKQSLTQARVEIAPASSFADLLRRVPRGTLPVLCQADGAPLAPLLKRATSNGILIACGPEGDFTPGEVSAAERSGFIRASLGRNRLRTETAALAALAIASSALAEIK